MAVYTIERLTAGNLKHLRTLYAAVFRKQISHQFLSKKYDTKFAGAEYIGYLAMTVDNFPAAFYGVLPCMFRLKGEIILAAQSADTMTHPSHRRAGLFLQLAQRTYALARQHGIEFIFGFPNQSSLPGFRKLNWNFLPAPMKLFTLRGNAVPFAKVICKIPLASIAHRRILMSLQCEQGETARTFDRNGDGVIMDNTFMGYKKYSNTFFICVDNVPVWIKPDGMLKIGYANPAKITSPEVFLRKMQKLTIRFGFSRAIFITSVTTPLFKILAPHAVSQDSFQIGYYPLSSRNLDFSDVQFEYCDIDIF